MSTEALDTVSSAAEPLLTSHNALDFMHTQSQGGGEREKGKEGDEGKEVED